MATIVGLWFSCPCGKAHIRSTLIGPETVCSCGFNLYALNWER